MNAFIANNPLKNIQGVKVAPDKSKMVLRDNPTVAQMQKIADSAVETNKSWGLKSYLELYPNWVVKQQNARYIKPHQAVMAEVGKKTSMAMQQVAKVQNITFDDALGRWVGPFIQQQSKKFVGSLKSAQSSQLKSKALISYKIGIQRLKDQIPNLVSSVVNASQILTKTGFGPLRQGGIDLYAGRYFNPMTNRIDVLPRASKLVVNPLSYQQNLAYEQARLLNKWNQYVDQQQKLIKLSKMTPQQFKTTQQAKINKGLTMGTPSQSDESLLRFYNKLKGIFIKFATNSLPENSPYYSIIPALASNFQKLNPTYSIESLTPLQVTAMKAALNQMAEAAYNFIKPLQDNIDGSISSPEQRIRQKKRYVTALMSLDWKSMGRVKGSALKAYKATVIPVKFTNRSEAATLARSMKVVTKKLNQTAFGGQIGQKALQNIGVLKKNLQAMVEQKSNFLKIKTPSARILSDNLYNQANQRFDYFQAPIKGKQYYNNKTPQLYDPSKYANRTYREITFRPVKAVPEVMQAQAPVAQDVFPPPAQSQYQRQQKLINAQRQQAIAQQLAEQKQLQRQAALNLAARNVAQIQQQQQQQQREQRGSDKKSIPQFRNKKKKKKQDELDDDIDRRQRSRDDQKKQINRDYYGQEEEEQGEIPKYDKRTLSQIGDRPLIAEI